MNVKVTFAKQWIELMPKKQKLKFSKTETNVILFSPFTAADLALNPNTLVNNYSASLSTPTSPQGNDSNIVQYSQGPTPNQSPINCKD